MRYNLYYILREDQKRHPLSYEADCRIRAAVKHFYLHRPPPEASDKPPGENPKKV